MEGFDSESGTDSGEELENHGVKTNLTNRKQGFPSQIIPSSNVDRVFLFFCFNFISLIKCD